MCVKSCRPSLLATQNTQQLELFFFFFCFHRHQSLHRLLDAIIKPEINLTSVLILGQKIGLQSKDICPWVHCFWTARAPWRLFSSRHRLMRGMAIINLLFSPLCLMLRKASVVTDEDVSVITFVLILAPSPSCDYGFLVGKLRLILLSLIMMSISSPKRPFLYHVKQVT